MRDSAKKSIVMSVPALALTVVAVVSAVALFDSSPVGAVGRPGGSLGAASALQVPADAETVFLEQCAPCHGSEGEGGIGPPLTSSTASAADRIQVIRSGRNAMPAFENTLDAASIEAVSTLVGRLAATTIYAQQCAPCHGAGGEGGIGPALTSGDLSYEEARLVITEGEAAMPAFGPTLTEDQLDGVTLFIQHLTQIRAGSELYAEHCAACHGAVGEGGAGPVLAGTDVTPLEIIAVISEGAGAMPGFGTSLTDAELKAVISFTRQMVAGSEVAPSPGRTGADLYVELCGACHGADGEGGAGPPLAPVTVGDDEMATLIAEGRGSMPGFASELSTDDIDGLVEYVRSSFGEQEAPASGSELYAGLCAVCHGAEGQGGTGPSLQPLATSTDELSTLISQGRGSMPGFASDLTADEAEALIEFVETAFAGQAVTTTTAAPPMLSGSEMFADHCARCHGASGGGDTGPDLSNTDLSLNEIISRIYGGHAGGMPAFEGELTGLEVQELARFVTTLTAEPGSDDTGGAGWWWPVLLGGLVGVSLVALAFVRRGRKLASGGSADTNS